MTAFARPDNYDDLRALFKKGDDERDKDLPTHIPEVERIDNLSYGPDSKWNLLDIYLPSQRSGKVPTIISVHGGGWVYGTKETYQFYCMSLAKEGFGVVNFNYRLGPEVAFPGIIDDIDLLMHWLEKNAGNYQLDLSNTFMIGDSAGAQMAAQYLTIMTNDTYRQKFGYNEVNFKIKAAALNCGAYFINYPDVLDGSMRGYFTEEVMHKYDEILHTENFITQDFPKTYLVTSNQDFLRDCTVRFDAFLTGKEIAHEFHTYGDEDNPKPHDFHCNIKDNVAQNCNHLEMEWFKQFI